MKFAFCTCVQIGLSCMEAIYDIGGHLKLVISLPDDKAVQKSGRIYVDEFANKNNIPVLKSNHVNDQIVKESLIKYKIDWLFIIGWSQIASKEIIETPTGGAIGAHPTLLPVGRGRAAIPWAIIKGLDKTGVTFFKMDEGVDTGKILGQEVVGITKNETATTLYQKIDEAHISLIKKLYPKLENGKIEGYEQNEEKATYWPGRKPEDGLIKPQEMTVEEVDRLVRAVTKPYPGAFLIKDEKKIIIWEGSFETQMINQIQDLDIKCKDGHYFATKYEILE